MQSLSQNNTYGCAKFSQGGSSMYVHQSRISLGRGHSISVIDVIS